MIPVLANEGHAAITVRTAGRLAGLLFAGSGLITLLTLPLLDRSDTNRAGILVVGLGACAVGALTWALPWERWPPRATLVLVPVAFVLIAVGNAFAPSYLLTYGIFFVVLFVWIGISQPQWTSLLMAPLALAAYVLPLGDLPVGLGVGVASAVLTVPVCVLIGESLAWSARRVVRTREELLREQAIAGRLQELQQMEETWISAVSHELRTPITICRGHLEVLDPDARPEEVRRALRVVLEELGRMGRLAEDVTTLAGLEGRSLVTLGRVEVADFMAGVAAKAEPILNGRLRLGDAPSEAWLKADPDRLTQALLNLLQNAAVHVPDDSPVSLRVARERRWWRFEVSDLGPGPPPEIEPSVFEPFIRGKGPDGGSGLGLAIVRAIARAHQGEVGVTNSAGEGVSFWIRIPA